MSKDSSKIPVTKFYCLEVSTAHIKEETAERLNEEETTTPYGWFLWNPISHKEDEFLEWRDYPEDLKKIFRFAAENNCTYILLDQDAPIYEEDLDIYEW